MPRRRHSSVKNPIHKLLSEFSKTISPSRCTHVRIPVRVHAQHGENKNRIWHTAFRVLFIFSPRYAYTSYIYVYIQRGRGYRSEHAYTQAYRARLRIHEWRTFFIFLPVSRANNNRKYVYARNEASFPIHQCVCAKERERGRQKTAAREHSDDNRARAEIASKREREYNV